MATIVTPGKADPSITSSDYDAQFGHWELVNALLGGEASLKNPSVASNGSRVSPYLPKFTNEKQDVYNYRLAYAPFTNIYDDISKNLASKPFSKELVMDESTPDQYLELAENIDGQGNNLNVFSANVYKAAQDKGVDWILIDYKKTDFAPGQPVSLAEARRQKLRPYWVRIAAEDMLAVYSEFLDGQEVIHHARIWETSKEVDSDFNEVLVERVRVFSREAVRDEQGMLIGFDPPTWKVWTRTTDSVGNDTWAPGEEGTFSVDEIPLVPVILTKRIGSSWIVAAPLKHLAYMQLTEFHQEANLEWVKVMTCFPMVAVSGLNVDENTEVSLGPNKTFIIPQNNAGTGPAGDVKIIEPGAQSIVECRSQLELTRKEMRDIGMQPMTSANLTVITTANVSKKASSSVQAWAYMFKDSLEKAWKITAQFMGDASFEPEVIIHTDFAVEAETGNELNSLLASEKQGIFSKQTVRDEFRRRKIVDNNLTDKEEEERLAIQGESLEPEEDIDPRTGERIVVAAAAA